MSDDVLSAIRNGKSNPIDRLSEKLESIRTVHSMAIIGAGKGIAEKTREKNDMVERCRSGKCSLGALDAVSSSHDDLDHSELSAEGAEDAITNLDAVLSRLNEVPINSRANYAISMNSAFEVFLGELLTFAFTRRPECLKNTSATLNDQALVQAILDDEVMETLVSARVRKIMSEPFFERAVTINKLLSIDTSNIRGLKELNLVRNCLVHNDGMPSQELLKHHPKYDRGNRIMLDEAFLNEQHRLIFRIANELWIDITTVIENVASEKERS